MSEKYDEGCGLLQVDNARSIAVFNCFGIRRAMSNHLLLEWRRNLAGRPLKAVLIVAVWTLC